MAYWAKINDDNIVIQVTVGDDFDPAGDQGYSWLINNLGGTWIRTFKDATDGTKFAGINDVYDAINNVFIAPIIEETEEIV